MEELELDWDDLGDTRTSKTRPISRATVALATLCQLQIESERTLCIISAAASPTDLRAAFRTLRELVDKAESAALPS